MENIRRRQLMGNKIDYLLYPDCLYMLVNTTNENETFSYGYALYDAIDYYVIDGIKYTNISTIKDSNGGISPIFPEPGTHEFVVHHYKKPSTAMFSCYIRHKLEYLRVPYNAKGLYQNIDSAGWGVTFKQIDWLSDDYVQNDSGVGLFAHSTPSIIRVPIGVKTKWEGKIPTTYYNRMEEYNFKYKKV